MATAHSLGAAQMFHPVRCISMQQNSVERSELTTQTSIEAIISALSTPCSGIVSSLIPANRIRGQYSLQPYLSAYMELSTVSTHDCADYCSHLPLVEHRGPISVTMANSPGRYNENTTGTRFSVRYIMARNRDTCAITIKERKPL